MRWICYVGISVILSLELQAQSLIEQLDSGSQQWLMETFEESYPPVSHAGECPEAWKYAGDLPELVQLKDRNCGAWRNSKAMCDLLFPLVQRKLESQNMSEDYVYLALALSGLDMHRSYKGRAGIWQLTFPVALAHGLDVEDTADQRYAPDISTDAALAYLAELEYRFHDKPHLAVLAFVHSVPYVHGLSDQQALEEAAEWQEKLAALKSWYEGTKRGAYLLDLIGVLNTHENVVFEQDISYEVLHDALGVSEAYLRGGNPVFRAETIPANYRAMPFLLTADAAGRMEELGDSLYAWEAKLAAEREAKRIAAAEARKPPAGSARTYTVRSGDVLGSIAQRNGVRVSEIKRWNGLKSDRINVGQKLLLYPDGKTTPKPNPASTTSGSSSTPSADAPPAQNTATPSDSPVQTASTYTVKSGDSLWLIAKKFPGVSAEDIMAHNKVDANISPGQVLNIPKAQ